VFIIMFVLPTILSLGAGAKVKGITVKLCNLLGRISYPVYMTHGFTMVLFEHYYKNYKMTVEAIDKQFVITIVLILIVFNLLFSYAIMRWVDEPVRKWLKKKTMDKSK